MSKKKYIDADRLSRQISDTRLNLPHDSKDFFTRDFMLLNFQQTIDLEPAADVVEVVRCKDCKRCYEKRTKRGNQLMRFCMRMDGNEYQVNANDFCSYGTPKERGGEK